MKVQRHAFLSGATYREHWCIEGDPLPPPSGQVAWPSPAAYDRWLTVSWLPRSTALAMPTLDPTAKS